MAILRLSANIGVNGWRSGSQTSYEGRMDPFVGVVGAGGDAQNFDAQEKEVSLDPFLFA